MQIVGAYLSELEEMLKGWREPSFRAKQIWQWVYARGAKSFDEMSNLPLALRNKLKAEAGFKRLEIAQEQKSVDGTIKWLFRLHDGNEIETVYIPEKTRATLCVSSQVGCTLNCKFCHTGTQRLVRDLSAEEILLQVMTAKDRIDDWSGTDVKRLTNIVMMGMGEPLLNYAAVEKALKIAMDGAGMNFSRQKITLSTSGIVPLIAKCGQNLGVNLAISLHATNDKLRDEIVPINKKYPIEELLQVCRQYYPEDTKVHRITFEYVMLKDVNDSVDEARALVKMIRGIPAKINLIPFNPWPGTFYACSEQKQIAKFAAIVEKAGYMSPVRTPRGQDIFAACGQLKSASEKLSKAEAARRKLACTAS
jgi:23S rRNA (adenine2503-C2)-methyltransferase